MMRKVFILGAAFCACCLAGCATGGKNEGWEDRSAFVGSELDAFFGPIDGASKTVIMIGPNS
jgi:hypothetical protein